MIRVRSSSSLSVLQKRVRRKSLFVSRFSPDVTASDVEKSINDQLQLASLTCTRLKTNIILTPRFMSLLQRMISTLSIILVSGQTAA
jgi:hypothetical protein